MSKRGGEKPRSFVENTERKKGLKENPFSPGSAASVPKRSGCRCCGGCRDTCRGSFQQNHPKVHKRGICLRRQRDYGKPAVLRCRVFRRPVTNPVSQSRTGPRFPPAYRRAGPPFPRPNGWACRFPGRIRRLKAGCRRWRPGAAGRNPVWRPRSR